MVLPHRSFSFPHCLHQGFKFLVDCFSPLGGHLLLRLLRSVPVYDHVHGFGSGVLPPHPPWIRSMTANPPRAKIVMTANAFIVITSSPPGCRRNSQCWSIGGSSRRVPEPLEPFPRTCREAYMKSTNNSTRKHNKT